MSTDRSRSRMMLETFSEISSIISSSAWSEYELTLWHVAAAGACAGPDPGEGNGALEFLHLVWWTAAYLRKGKSVRLALYFGAYAAICHLSQVGTSSWWTVLPPTDIRGTR
ncbi:hypothetical protein PHISCL_02520 [Aspergillus sclerotialis]|uniref:Uncharacterized protein n=1 Tax=Aspergillus sclerotialis TaxID=2070753 RepID=A0A3A3A0E1_9EURO|nr:hypothetical protein PHISCL_02520 [Aspergillus sclerotialis]